MTRSLKKDKALFRGDDPAGVTIPVPAADASLVRHILYLGGKGRETPYLSTSEDRTSAEVFGAVWETSHNKVKAEEHRGVRVRAYTELLAVLQGRGHGDAGGYSPFQVSQARKFVERHLEHLLDFRGAKAESKITAQQPQGETGISADENQDLRRLVVDLFAR